MKIYLINPGENDGNDLTENGTLEIKSLVRRLKLEGFEADCIYTNGHSISTQTGKILSRSFNLPIFSDERFSESALVNCENEQENNYHINQFIDEVVSSGKNVIIAIGSEVHRRVISRLIRLPLEVTKQFSLFPASLSLVTYDSNQSTGNWRITYLNDTTHLRVP